MNEQDIYNCRKFIETISDQEIDFPYPNSDAIAHINKVIQREIEKVRKDIKENDKD
ncbi:MAG: hypothetical protein K2Q22_13555 [Cytophagales bacterium]|nr:hypothetical protein [Cytophagales bacterium]